MNATIQNRIAVSVAARGRALTAVRVDRVEASAMMVDPSRPSRILRSVLVASRVRGRRAFWAVWGWFRVSRNRTGGSDSPRAVVVFDAGGAMHACAAGPCDGGELELMSVAPAVEV